MPALYDFNWALSYFYNISCFFFNRYLGLSDSDSQYSFCCNVLPTGITLETFSSTPNAVIDWFCDWAKGNGFIFFDSQTEISDSDLKEFETRMPSIRAKRDARIKKEDFPGLEARANAGDPRALVEPGNRYNFGEGIEANPSKAFICYQRAAQAGNPESVKGELVVKD